MLVGVAGFADLREQSVMVMLQAGKLVEVTRIMDLRDKFVMITLWEGSLIGESVIRNYGQFLMVTSWAGRWWK